MGAEWNGSSLFSAGQGTVSQSVSQPGNMMMRLWWVAGSRQNPNRAMVFVVVV